jgi:surface polysaccharide O-acyltransferase-like enzyme
MFFMITGATLLNYQQRMSTRQYCARRIRSTVIPYCAWTVIAIIFFAFGPFKVTSTELSARQIIKAFLRPESSSFTFSIYWFFPALFGVYIAIPFITSMKYRYVKALAFVLAIFESALPTLSALLGTKLLNADFLSALSVGYVMFAVLGYVLSKEEMPLGWRCVLYLCGALACGAEFFGTLEVSNVANGVVKTFKGYLSFYCVLQTSAVFVFIKNICT